MNTYANIRAVRGANASVRTNVPVGKVTGKERKVVRRFVIQIVLMGSALA